MAGAEQVDQHLLAALRKQRSGDSLTQREEIALKRYEKGQREKFGAAYVRSLPKKEAIAASGVTNKTLLEWSDRFDAPWEPHGKTVDGFKLLRWACGVIAECSAPIAKHLKAKRNKPAVDEFFPEIGVTDWQEECFKERAMALADERLLRHKHMLDAQLVGEIHGRIAKRLQAFGDNLGKRYGDEAQRLFLHAWDDIAADIMRLLDSGGTDNGGDDQQRPGEPDR